MKRYVSAFLINALLIQLYGCYTLRTYSYEDFRSMDDIEEVSIIYNTNAKVTLNKDPLDNNYTKWIAETDTLRIYSANISDLLSNPDSIISDSLILAKNQINKVQIKEFDEVRAVTYSVVFVGLVVLVIVWVDNIDPPMSFKD
jgi:hypothetical protein